MFFNLATVTSKPGVTNFPIIWTWCVLNSFIIMQGKSWLFLLLQPFSEVHISFYALVVHSLMHYIVASFRKESSSLEGGTIK